MDQYSFPYSSCIVSRELVLLDVEPDKRLLKRAFVCMQPQDIQQDQLTRDNAAAVREAVLVHARPILNLDPFLGGSASESLSASNWKRLSPILAVLMPVFWFGVIKGLWGSVKVSVLQFGTVLVHG